MTRILLFSLCSVVSVLSYASVTQIQRVHLSLGCNVRVVSEVPEDRHVADILFLTGFSDRADNHKPLFSKLASAGYRVISFDYPSHGETNCFDLDFHNFSSLSRMAAHILELPQFKSNKPLYISGWSTGGLLSYRLAQRGYFRNRNIAGLILLAPGFSVYKIPGDKGLVTQASLLSNARPPHRGPIKPVSPLLYLGFSTSLMTNSVLARNQAVPNVPILMILGDDDADVYANSLAIKKWYRGLGARATWAERSFTAVQCAGAKHEVDNEIEPIGNSVRQMFLDFVEGKPIRSVESTPCRVVR